jgi:uncharacterized membrane protein
MGSAISSKLNNSMNTFFILKLLAIAGCGLIAGVFFAFSTFVMQALAQRPAPEGIAAMQSINITVINPWFMTVFLGMGVVCLMLSIFGWQQPGTTYLLIASLLYLVGTIGVTMVCNVPLNDALAHTQPNSPEGATLWAKYLTNWTFWNHVRAIAALIATVLFSITLSR